MPNILEGMLFFNHYSIPLDVLNHLIHFRDVPLQLCKANGEYNCNTCDVIIPNIAEKLNPLFKFLQTFIRFELSDTIRDSMLKFDKNLAKTNKLSLGLFLPENQLVMLCDASEHAVYYVLLAEDYPDAAEGPSKHINRLHSVP